MYLYIVTIQYCCSGASRCSCSVRKRVGRLLVFSLVNTHLFAHMFAHSAASSPPCLLCLGGFTTQGFFVCWTAHSPTVISECFLLPESSAQRARRGRGGSRLLQCKNLFLFFPAATWRGPKRHPVNPSWPAVNTITTWTEAYFVSLHGSFQVIGLCPWWRKGVKSDALVHVLSIPQALIITVSAGEREAIVCVFVCFALRGKWLFLFCFSRFNRSANEAFLFFWPDCLILLWALFLFSGVVILVVIKVSGGFLMRGCTLAKGRLMGNRKWSWAITASHRG